MNKQKEEDSVSKQKEEDSVIKKRGTLATVINQTIQHNSEQSLGFKKQRSFLKIK